MLVHGNLSAVDRLKNLRKFVEGKEVKILIASDVLSRGTDIKDISHVINYDSPESLLFWNTKIIKLFFKELTTYIHRVGRTARMGKEGKNELIFMGALNPEILVYRYWDL